MRTRRSGRKARAPASGGLSPIDMLPDDVLGRILAMVWDMNSPGVANPALVSRRWRRVFFSEPGIWRHTSTVLPNHSGPAGFRVEEGMLRRVAPLVHSLVAAQREAPEGLSPAAGEQLAATLRLLRTAPLARLALEWAYGGLPAQACSPRCLGQLPGLTELSLRSVRLPEEAARALCQLSRLQDLAVEARVVSCTLAERVLPQLTRLTRLHLGSSLPLPSLACLSTLRGLRHLALVEDSDAFAELPWGPHEEFAYARHRQRAMEQGLQPLAVPPPPTLPDLALFHFFNSCAMMHRGVQVAPGVELEFCRYEQQQRAAEGGAAVAFQVLHVMGGGTGGLAQALEAVLRPGLPLEELSVYGCSPGDGQLGGCAATLAPLRTLRLDNFGRGDGWEGAAEALLARAPALRSLHLMGCAFAGGPPAWLVQRQGLERLVLPACWLTDLPPGPYLQGLTELSVVSNPMPRLPPALTTATALRHLAIGGPGDGLQLSVEDLEVLCALPRLEQLNTAACKPGSRVARALRRARLRLVVAPP